MLYLIHAFEGIFQGLHGIEEWDIVDCASEEEAYEIMEQMSYELMDQYNDVMHELEAVIEYDTTDDMDQSDIDQLTEEVYAENVGGEIWKIDPNKITDFLMEKCKRDPDEFVHKYCY